MTPARRGTRHVRCVGREPLRGHPRSVPHPSEMRASLNPVPRTGFHDPAQRRSARVHGEAPPPWVNPAYYGSATPRRVRAPGLHPTETPKHRHLVGRVPSPGTPISSIMRIAGANLPKPSPTLKVVASPIPHGPAPNNLPAPDHLNQTHATMQPCNLCNFVSARCLAPPNMRTTTRYARQFTVRN